MSDEVQQFIDNVGGANVTLLTTKVLSASDDCKKEKQIAISSSSRNCLSFTSITSDVAR